MLNLIILLSSLPLTTCCVFIWHIDPFAVWHRFTLKVQEKNTCFSFPNVLAAKPEGSGEVYLRKGPHLAELPKRLYLRMHLLHMLCEPNMPFLGFHKESHAAESFTTTLKAYWIYTSEESKEFNFQVN